MVNLNPEQYLTKCLDSVDVCASEQEQYARIHEAVSYIFDNSVNVETLNPALKYRLINWVVKRPDENSEKLLEVFAKEISKDQLQVFIDLGNFESFLKFFPKATFDRKLEWYLDNLKSNPKLAEWEASIVTNWIEVFKCPAGTSFKLWDEYIDCIYKYCPESKKESIFSFNRLVYISPESINVKKLVSLCPTQFLSNLFNPYTLIQRSLTPELVKLILENCPKDLLPKLYEKLSPIDDSPLDIQIGYGNEEVALVMIEKCPPQIQSTFFDKNE